MHILLFTKFSHEWHICIKTNFLMFIYFWETKTECEQGRDRERDRQRIWSRLRALSCQHRACCGAQTRKPWDHDLSWHWMLNQLSHPGAPMFVYFWERDRVGVGKGQREREIENLKQAPGSELTAQSLMQGSNSWTVRSWPEPKSGT